MAESKVFMFDGADPEMAFASAEARRTFRYFWRELAWERRRIVPALDMATVKAPFSDGDAGTASSDEPQVEQMWIDDVDFDGRDITGTLLNSPNWLTSVKQGDQVRVPLTGISDWMYVMEDEVYGAYTVQLMRSRMDRSERAAHDRAWGLQFGDPAQARVVPPNEPQKRGFLKKLFGGKQEAPPVQPDDSDHPMSVNMGSSLQEAIQSDPSFMTTPDERGFTLLHHLALAGSVTGVKVLLAAGANPKARTKNGQTPADLARALNWDPVLALLAGR